MRMLMEKKVVLSLRGITKSFPGVKALDGIYLDFYEGEVHSLCGENGAGKSTLMKILSGVYPLDQGEIYIDGKRETIRNPQDALSKGQSIIFQEFNLVDALSIAENIFMGRLSNKRGTWVNWRQLNEEAKKLMLRVGYDIDPATLVRDLSVAEKQMVEIAKALSYHSRVIIMDEPSAALTSNEVEKLMKIIRDLKREKVTVIYISHKLEEVMEISDRVSVLRDGKIISTNDAKELNQERIVEHMVGRTIDQEYPKRATAPGGDAEVVLEVKGLTRKGVFEDISFRLHRGENSAVHIGDLNRQCVLRPPHHYPKNPAAAVLGSRRSNLAQNHRTRQNICLRLLQNFVILTVNGDKALLAAHQYFDISVCQSRRVLHLPVVVGMGNIQLFRDSLVCGSVDGVQHRLALVQNAVQGNYGVLLALSQIVCLQRALLLLAGGQQAQSHQRQQENFGSFFHLKCSLFPVGTARPRSYTAAGSHWPRRIVT